MAEIKLKNCPICNSEVVFDIFFDDYTDTIGSFITCRHCDLKFYGSMDGMSEEQLADEWKVDYIITHCPPASIVALLGHGLYEQDELTKYLEEIRCNTEYKRWFAGHFHINKAVNDKDILLYEQIVRIL